MPQFYLRYLFNFLPIKEQISALPAGVEPASLPPEGNVLSIKL